VEVSAVVTDETPIIDVDKALELMGGRELFAEIVGMLLDELPDLVDQLRAEAAAGDLVALSKTAHRLKGNFGVVAAEQAYAAARDLEYAGREENVAMAELCLVELEAAIERVEDELRALIAP
jgi:HPt (histidine-containing phosphotransfer) domain-containing protein